MTVLEFRCIEMPGLGLQDVLGEFDHLARQLDRWDVVEILGGVSDPITKPRLQCLIQRKVPVLGGNTREKVNRLARSPQLG